MKDLFGLLIIFGWYVPLFSLASEIVHDPTPLRTNTHAFFFSAATADGATTARILNQAGIKTWGHSYDIAADEFSLDVAMSEAGRAAYLLTTNGIEIAERSFPTAPPTKPQSVFNLWGLL